MTCKFMFIKHQEEVKGGALRDWWKILTEGTETSRRDKAGQYYSSTVAGVKFESLRYLCGTSIAETRQTHHFLFFSAVWYRTRRQAHEHVSAGTSNANIL